MEDKYIERLRPHKHQGRGNGYLSGGEKLNVTGEGYTVFGNSVRKQVLMLLRFYFLNWVVGIWGCHILHKMLKSGHFNNIF